MTPEERKDMKCDRTLTPAKPAEPDKCPRCDSPAPHLHPAMQWEGEVQPCSDPWHKPRKPAEEHVDTQRLDWLEKQVKKHLYYSDIAIQSDEEDGVWFSQIYRRDCGELKGMSFDPTDSKTQTVREAIDAAMKSEEGR